MNVGGKTIEHELNMTNNRIKYFQRQSHHVITLSLLLLVTLLSGCYYDVVIEEEIATTKAMSFTDDVIPVFKSTCISCHDGVVAYPNLVANQAFEALAVGNYIDHEVATSSKLVVKLNDNHPFEGSVTSSEIKKIILWIEQGAKNN